MADATRAAETVREDVPCVHCGYNLRGFQVTGACPGCEAPIADSAHGGRLRFAEPRWLKCLLSGADWLLGWLGVLAGAVVTYVITLLVVVIPMAIDQQSAGRDPAAGATHWLQLLFLLPGVIAIVGVWRLTAPEPGGGLSKRSWAGLARWALTGGYVLQLVHWVMQLYVDQPLLVPQLSVLLAVGLGAVGVFALLGHLAQLAGRLPAAGLARQTRFVQWGLSAALAIVVIHGTAVVASDGPQPGGPLGVHLMQRQARSAESADPTAPAKEQGRAPTPGDTHRGEASSFWPWAAAGGCVVSLALAGFGLAAVVLTFHHRHMLAQAVQEAEARAD
jgi:hypothetical protein